MKVKKISENQERFTVSIEECKKLVEMGCEIAKLAIKANTKNTDWTDAYSTYPDGKTFFFYPHGMGSPCTTCIHPASGDCMLYEPMFYRGEM